ncbi:hypothetical protein FJ364_00365 [Candidatus Dependentiae bacterium]|nr:hypothetical protein [Candidatus Dependentiae bacterium]
MKRVLLTVALSMLCVGVKALNPEQETALIKEIGSIKEKLAEYKISQSISESALSVMGSSLLGGCIGAVAGGVQLLIVNQLFSDLSLLERPGHTQDLLNVMQTSHVAASTLSGVITGFLLGIASRTGSLPQLSKSKLSLLLALNSLIGAILSISVDFIATERLTESIRHELAQDHFALFIPQDRRSLFQIVARQVDTTNREYPHENSRNMIFRSFALSLISHAAALLLVVPEVFVVRGMRHDLREKKEILEASLEDLQSILRKNRLNALDVEA